MLTRSASKKITASPKKYVKKKGDVIAATDNVQDYKVMIPSLTILNTEGNVRSPPVLVNFNVLPEENGSDGVIQDGSKTVFNCGVVLINMLPSDPDKGKESCSVDSNMKVPFSTLKLKPKTIHTSGRSTSDEESESESYRTFSPGLTSSVRKCNRLLQPKMFDVKKSNSESDRLWASFSEKIRLQCNTSDDVTDTSQELSLYKGVRVNGGYRASDFKKIPVVQIVPVSEEEIKSWSNGLDCSVHIRKKSGSPDSEEKKMVQKKKLLKILKKTDNSISRQLAEKREKNLSGWMSTESVVAHNGGQSCDKNSRQNGGASLKMKKVLDFNRVFGDFQKYVEELIETDGHLIASEFLEKCISSQDSICTEVFDDETLEQHMTLSPVNESLDAEEGRNNVKIPATDSFEGKVSSVKEDITSILDRLSPESKRMTIERDTEAVSEKGSSERTQQVVLHTDGVDDDRSWRQSSSARKRKKKDSPRKIRKIKLNRTLIGDATIEQNKTYRDRQTLLSIQLECIDKEILSRSEQGESPKNSIPSKKSKQPEDDVTDFGPARRTRKSLRVLEEEESKENPKTRNTPKTQTKGPMDEYVTVTPRSTRATSLRREVTEVLERKRRKREDFMETPKMSKTPKKESLTEEAVNDANEDLSIYSSRRTSRKETKDNEAGHEENEEESSTPRKRGSSRKTSQMEETEKDDGGDRAEVTFSKSRESKSPMKSPVGETEDEEVDEKAMEAVSSPLKKKKEAAERLRAEEEKLGHRQKEVAVAVMSSPKKIKSPETAAPKENIEIPILSTPKKTTRKSLGDRQKLVEESLNSEVSLSPEQKETKSPKKHVRDECTKEESDEGKTASPKRTKIKSPEKQMQKVPESVKSESEVNILSGGGTLTPRKSKSPTKTRNVEVPEVEDEVTEEVDLAVLTSPKQQKSKSAQKRQHSEVKCVVEMPQVTTPEPLKSKSPKKRHKEEREAEEIELKDVEMSILSPKRQKNSSAENRHTEEDESQGNVVEVDIRVISPENRKMMKESIQQQDVELVCPDDSGSGKIEVLPEEQQKTNPSREEQEGEESESEEPPERREMKSSKKHAIRVDEEGESEKRHKRKSQGEKLKERKISDSEADEAEESVTTSVRQQSQAEDSEENDSDVETGVMTSSERQKKRATEGRVSHTAASPDKQKRNENEEEEAEAVGESSSMSKKSKSKKRKIRVQEDVGVSIPQLGEDFLASVPSQKTSVKVKDQTNIDEKLKRKKERKRKKLLKRMMKNDGYIPLEVKGPANFSVVELEKLNTSTRHPAFDLKRRLLYGSRVKRIPYSQVQSYQMKMESRKMRF